jgi:hypothetical protein
VDLATKWDYQKSQKKVETILDSQQDHFQLRPQRCLAPYHQPISLIQQGIEEDAAYRLIEEALDLPMGYLGVKKPSLDLPCSVQETPDFKGGLIVGVSKSRSEVQPWQ